MSNPSNPDPKKSGPLSEAVLFVVAAFVVVVIGYLVFKSTNARDPLDKILGTAPAPRQVQESTNKYGHGSYVAPGFVNHWNPTNAVTFWLGQVPDRIRRASPDTGTNSNIRMADYAGQESCRECHADNHAAWWNHPHRRMNARATPEHVVGDFSGKKEINYLGGVGSFFTENGRYQMRLERAGKKRVYAVSRTIGSRFFQYYVGTLLESDHQESPMAKTLEHVLPFGYWIDQKEWVPTVHVFRTNRDDDIRDPYTDREIAPYDGGCSVCHNTQPLGDWAINPGGTKRLSGFSPHSVAFDVSAYLKSERPEFVIAKDPADITDADITELQHNFNMIPFQGNGVSMGIACEACHNGSKEHARRSTKTASDYLPSFFPKSPNVFIPQSAGDNPPSSPPLRDVHARSKANANFICARCHSGGRPTYANGIDTWNSTEFSDAVKGSCYKSAQDPHGTTTATLSCVHCHDPHEGIGPKWKRTAKQDNNSCLACHEQFREPADLTAHTHHASGSAGSDCMSCHMPKINEGMQEMVRTHRIFNPTDKEMIEANQPNACNLCHLDKPIDWTIGHLRDWYGKEHRYSERALVRSYPDRRQPVGLSWLRGTHAPTRLAAAGAAATSAAPWVLPELFRLLAEDEQLLNRQFTQRRLEERLGIKFKDKGYQFYMTGPERTAAIRRIIAENAKQ
jgi:hypothetical protein